MAFCWGSAMSSKLENKIHTKKWVGEASKRKDTSVESSNGTSYMLPGGMRPYKHLMRCLSKVVNHTSKDSPLLCVRDAVQIGCSAVRQMMEDVEVLHGSFSSLLVPKDEIDPLVQILAHIRTLQCLSMLGDEYSWVTLGPGREFDMVNLGAVALSITKVVSVDVGQELGQTEELGDKLSHISLVSARCRFPCLGNRLEEPISVIEATSLK